MNRENDLLSGGVDGEEKVVDTLGNVPTLSEAYQYEMDQRMIDVNDPTSFGTDTVHAIDENKQHPEETIEDQNEEKVKSKKDKNKLPRDVTIITEDVEWGDRGHGQPVLLQHGHHLDSLIWFKEKKVGKPIPLQLFDAGYDVWLGNNRGSYNCEL